MYFIVYNQIYKKKKDARACGRGGGEPRKKLDHLFCKLLYGIGLPEGKTGLFASIEFFVDLLDSKKNSFILLYMLINMLIIGNNEQI